MRMKSFLFILILALALGIPAGAGAIDWTIANQITCSWSPVTEYEGGGPIAAPIEVIKYRVYMVDARLNPDKIDPVDLTADSGPIEGTVYTTTFTLMGKFLLGVAAVLFYDGVEEVSSDIAWSDDPLATDGAPWGVKYFHIPKKPGGLKRQ